MANVSAVEGEADFVVPAAGKPCKTWYKVYGDLKSRTPLVVIHGGPGVTHQYLLSHTDLAEQHSIPVVFYDQIGCDRSTRLPEKKGDEAFWTIQLFIDELDNLLTHLGIHDDFDIVGSSWGCMLGAEYIARRPKGLRRAVLSSGPASIELWLKSTGGLLRAFPQEDQNIVTKNETAGTTEDPAYQAVCMKFAHTHNCRIDPWPAEVASVWEELAQDSTVASTMLGLSEFSVSGSLRDWSVVPKLHNINVPVLLTNGRYDTAQDVAMKPYFDLIPKVKWYRFAESAHMPHYEERERYMQLLAAFLE